MRRSFSDVLRFGFVLVFAVLSAGCFQTQRGPRLKTELNDNWRFVEQDVPRGEAISLNDRRWEKVRLPHTWNAQDGQDGGNDYYRGPGWYRRTLHIPNNYSKKSLFLRFEGASLVTNVYVNGQAAGEHRGGYGAFCFEITHLVRPGNNVLAVRVDNSKFDDVPPLAGDFTVFGGLYRSVHLLALEPLSISPLDDASPGVYLRQLHVDRDKAELEVVTKLRNAYASNTTAIVTCIIADDKGNTVISNSTETSVARNGQADSVQRMTLVKPRLWDGVNDPYLYRATIDVHHNGRLVDRVVQPLGLRFYSVDPNYGFFLNDRRYSLHGVNVHQDYPDKGYAVSRKDINRSYKLIRELGCTAVRMAHYQHHDYEYEWCNRNGLIVWAELALVNQVRHTPEFETNAKQQLRELIKQNFNHPSVCFWSLYNELGFGRSRDPQQWKLVHELNDLAHQLDGTRLTTAATSREADHPVNWIMDITAFNRYFGWYNGRPGDWGRRLDEFHTAYPERAIGMSEYGAGGSIHQHEVYPTRQPPTRGKWHPEEWQAIVHEDAYGAMRERPWLWGTFLWVMFDFASDGRAEGDALGINDKGLVTADRRTRKDAFYYYKAHWTTEPFVYVTSRRFNPRPPGTTTLKVYSNCDLVELFLNGKSIGRRAGSNRVFVWENVDLHGKRAEVVAVGTTDKKMVKDKVRWDLGKASSSTQPVRKPKPNPVRDFFDGLQRMLKR